MNINRSNHAEKRNSIMKQTFQLITDMNCDLPENFAKEHKIEMMSMGYSVDGVEYLTAEHPESLDSKEFYTKMREGAVTKTVALEKMCIRDRVGVDVDIAQAIADELGVKLVVENVDFDSIVPVSYTHLDVYKRQDYGYLLGDPALGNRINGI